MTGLLTVAAIIATIILLVSATSAGANATAGDPHRRGSWGIATWTSDRSRALNPHERRWQTALLASRDNDSRWRDLVAEVHKLERLSNIHPPTTAPQQLDAKWLDASIRNLESAIADHYQETQVHDGS